MKPTDDTTHKHTEESIISDPFGMVDIKYIPAILLQKINDGLFVREPEKLYELQYSSFAIPPYLYNFRCYPHLEWMRESYAFVLYFVIADSLYYVVPIIISIYSLVRFGQEMEKFVNFQCQSSTQRKLWTITRVIFTWDSFIFLLALLIMLCFTVYWLVVDPEAVFLFETSHYLNTFLIIIISTYFLLRKIGHLAKIIESLRKRAEAGRNERQNGN